MVYAMKIYVDGRCRGNGQPGAIGAAAAVFMLKSGDHISWTRVLPDHPTVTNQRGEITAIIVALEIALEKYRELESHPWLDVKLFSDSRYAVNCINDWIYKWSNSKSIENFLVSCCSKSQKFISRAVSWRFCISDKY